MKYVTFDIETIPCQDAKVIEKIASEITAPAQYRKPESIAEWLKENKEQAFNESLAKTSFDGALGSICCIGWGIDDGEIKSATGTESAVIETFFNDLKANNPRDLNPVFIGHNVSSFDLRFLFQRSIILGIKPPSFIPFNAKSWDDRIFDTMTYFAGYGNRIGLDKLCKALSIEGKQGITGADVWPMYQAGRIGEIAEYCEHDVKLTRDVYKRLTFKASLSN